ncbi:MAG: Zn-dependent exopeptidase M28 [Rhodanobacteraceae bacterium]|nr:Zn-dependent exopeptidase M28 [Rhodanobacteraceae bacterium]
MFSALALGLQMGLTTAMPMPAALVALDRHPQFELDRYTRQIEHAGGWWVELENRLLVAAPPSRLPGLLAGERVLSDLGWIRPDDLALQTRACGVDEGPVLPAIADTGRFALVRTPATWLPYKSPDISEWRPLQPNSTITKDLRARGLMAMAKAAPDPDVQLRVDALDTQRWFDALTTLAGFDRSSYGQSPNPGIDQARDWLIGQFGALGLQVTTQTFTLGGTATQVENVIARLPGSRHPEELVIVGGHYDSRQQNINDPSQSPGAEDNASGCAGVLEAARVFSAYPPQRTMVFVCFAGEEQGLYGGTAYAQSLQASGTMANIELAIIMDMIGYSGDADLDVLLETSSGLSTLFPVFTAAAATYAPELRLISDTSYCCSDHAPLISRGAPALLTIENDYSYNATTRPEGYQHYHRTTDLPRNVTRAQQMGGGILKMNIAVLTEAAGIATLFADGFD